MPVFSILVEFRKGLWGIKLLNFGLLETANILVFVFQFLVGNGMGWNGANSDISENLRDSEEETWRRSENGRGGHTLKKKK